MPSISRIISGEAGLGAAIAFLLVGAVLLSFAASAGIYLAAQGASSTSMMVLLLLPLLAGLVHASASFLAVSRGSYSAESATRIPVLALAGLYWLLQFSGLVSAVFLLLVFWQ